MSVTPPVTTAGRQPAWEVALLFPAQGHWLESDYLFLTNSTNRLVELADGRIEVIETPTVAHQLILDFLLDALKAFVRPRQLGRVLFAPLRMKLRDGNFREPDVLFMLTANLSRAGNAYWQRADLVMEVVSEGEEARKRDLVEKRNEYAAAAIPEYWIVDPLERRVTVLSLDGEAYAVHGEFTPGEQATSRLLEGFAVDVAATFEAAEGGV